MEIQAKSKIENAVLINCNRTTYKALSILFLQIRSLIFPYNSNINK